MKIGRAPAWGRSRKSEEDGRKEHPGTDKRWWLKIVAAAAAVAAIMTAVVLIRNVWAPMISAEGLPGFVKEKYLPVNQYSRPGVRLSSVNGIVLHMHSAPGTAAEQVRNEYALRVSTPADSYISSNFVIGADGKIIACIPPDEVSYASDSRNSDTISIEVVPADGEGGMSEEARKSAVRLMAWLCEKYGLTTDQIIRHSDINGTACPGIFAGQEEAWQALLGEVGEEMGDEAQAG